MLMVCPNCSGQRRLIDRYNIFGTKYLKVCRKCGGNGEIDWLQNILGVEKNICYSYSIINRTDISVYIEDLDTHISSYGGATFFTESMKERVFKSKEVFRLVESRLIKIEETRMFD